MLYKKPDNRRKRGKRERGMVEEIRREKETGRKIESNKKKKKPERKKERLG